MCLITFAWQMHAHYDLIMAANRDEFFARPSSAAHWWTDASGIYGGRDECAGGAWCAADTSGRIAAVTNVHTAEHDPHWRSRGWLVQAALGQNDSLTRHAAALGEQKQAYGPFNLLLAEQDELLFLSNRGQQQQLRLRPGVYAISNGHWDERWPKTERAERKLRHLLDTGQISVAALYALLADYPDAPVQKTDVAIGPDNEQLFSALFVHSRDYGTRASSVILRERSGRIGFYERSFDHGRPLGQDQQAQWHYPVK